MAIIISFPKMRHIEMKEEQDFDTFMLKGKHGGRVIHSKVPFFANENEGLFYNAVKLADWEYLDNGPPIPKEDLLEYIQEIAALRRQSVQNYVSQQSHCKLVERPDGYIQIIRLAEDDSGPTTAVDLPDIPDFLR